MYVSLYPVSSMLLFCIRLQIVNGVSSTNQGAQDVYQTLKMQEGLITLLSYHTDYFHWETELICLIVRLSN